MRASYAQLHPTHRLEPVSNGVVHAVDGLFEKRCHGAVVEASKYSRKPESVAQLSKISGGCMASIRVTVSLNVSTIVKI